MDFDGIKVTIKECKNPSDIIWLNRGVPRKEQLIRGAAVLLIILIVATIIYFLFSLEIAAQMYINYRANPPNVICDELFLAYKERGVKYMAGLEYFYLQSADSGVRNLTDKIS